MAAYRVELQRSAERDLARLSPALVARVADRIERLATEPRGRDCEKLAGIEAYRVRVGDLRFIYEIDDDRPTVIVVRVRHRREVYRQLR